MNRITDEGQYVEDFWTPTRPRRSMRRHWWWVVLLLAYGIAGLAIRSATAHLPEHSDWAATQFNQNNGQCCDGNDTIGLGDNEWRVVGHGTGSHYEVLHNGNWLIVPPHAMTKSKENPTGGALLWLWQTKVQCFKPGTFY